MLNVQSSERPLAYHLAKNIVIDEGINQDKNLASNNTFKFTGSSVNEADVVYDF